MTRPVFSDFVTPWRVTFAALAATAAAASFSVAVQAPDDRFPHLMTQAPAPVEPQEMRLIAPRADTSHLAGHRARVAAIVADEAEAHGVPVAVALAVAHTESSFRSDAVGPPTPWGRAYGVMQVIEPTARGMGHTGSRLALLDARVGARLGNRYLANALRECGGDVRCAAHRYHGGPNKRLHGPRTRRYGEMIVARAARYGLRGRPALTSGFSLSARLESDPLAFRAWLDR